MKIKHEIFSQLDKYFLALKVKKCFSKHKERKIKIYKQDINE